MYRTRILIAVFAVITIMIVAVSCGKGDEKEENVSEESPAVMTESSSTEETTNVTGTEETTDFTDNKDTEINRPIELPMVP